MDDFLFNRSIYHNNQFNYSFIVDILMINVASMFNTKDLTEIDKHIIRFKIISNAIDMLVGVTIMEGYHKYGATVCVRYGLIELRNFLKYHNSFLKIIDQRKEKIVSDLNPLLKEIFKYESQIVYDRNNWVGHIKEKGDMIEGKNPDDDIKLEDYFKMFFGVSRFYEGITKIFFEEYDNLSENLSKDEDDVFRTEHPNDELFQHEIRDRVSIVNKKLSFDNAGFQLDT